MVLLLLTAALSVLAIGSSIVALHRDGYRRVPTDATRLP
jgi:hypothetical protein